MDYLDISAGVLDDGDYLGEPRSVLSDTANVQPGLREYALRVWLFDAGRNPRKVVDILKDRTGLELGISTIRAWAMADDWEGRARDSHQKLQASESEAVMFTIGLGSVHAAQWLVDAIRSPDVSDTVKLKASQTVLGLAGYVPYPSGASNIQLAVNVGRDHELSGLSDEELDAQSRAYNPAHAVQPPIDITPTEAHLSAQHQGQGTYTDGVQHRSPAPVPHRPIT